MFVADLTALPSDHELHPAIQRVRVSLSQDRDAPDAIGSLPSGSLVKAVGWLGNAVPEVGRVRNAVLSRLFDAYVATHVFVDFSRGVHTCELCTVPTPYGTTVRWRDRQCDVAGRGHFLVHDSPQHRPLWSRLIGRTKGSLVAGGTIYIAPTMIIHYIVDHHYRPPNEFLRAVRKGRFMAAADLVQDNPHTA